MAKHNQQQRGGSTAKAAAVRAEQQRRERRRVLVMGGVVAAVLVIVLGGAIWVANDQAAAPELDDVPAASTDSDTGLAYGEADAPHEVVIYEDFLCPVCGSFEAQTNEDLSRLAADGEVLVEYRPFELLGRAGDYSKRAANAFFVVRDEAGAEVAKQFHDELYADQPSETASEFPDDDWLVEKAVAAGAEEDQVRGGIEGLEAGDVVDRATQEAQDAGVTGTPTVLVDGESVGGASIDEVAQNTLDRVED